MSLTPFAFVDGALDRADHLRGDREALQAVWRRARLLLLDHDGRAVTDDAGALHAIDAATSGAACEAATFLGLRDGVGWFVVDAEHATQVPDGRIDLRAAATRWPAWQATAFAQARALQHWHRRHRYCAACGHVLRYERAGWLGRCDGCGSEHYPRTDQAVIVAVQNGGRLLLGRQASWPPRRWSLVAGFVEPGETLEQAIAREVLEETGVRVLAGSPRYVASQPWPFPGSLMLGFVADAADDPPVARDELEDARWFDADAVRDGLAADWARADAEGDGIVLSSPISIARHVIAAWLAGAAPAEGP